MPVNDEEGRPRWEGDEKFRGTATGRAFREDVESLVTLMQRDAWVAEDPHVHVYPHIQRSIETIESLELIRGEEIPRGIFEVKLRWAPTVDTAGNLVREIYSVIGSFAETATAVMQKVVGDEIHFEVVTGLAPDTTHFETHGHLVRLRVTGDAAADAAENHREFMTPPAVADESDEEPSEGTAERP